MKKSPTYQIYMGSTGWAHTAWQGHFYPEDLPPEWQLMFYSNNYSCVYLPYAQWSPQDDATLSGWANNVAERFRFVLEANPQGMSAEDIRKAALLESSLGLVVDASGIVAPSNIADGTVLWLEQNQDLKQLAQAIQASASGHVPTYILSREHDVNALGKVKTLLEIMAL